MIDQLNRPQLIYSVNNDLDSWDIENLRYIRKISIRDSDSNDTLSYVSEDNQDNQDEEVQQLNSARDTGFILKSASLQLPKNYGHTQIKSAVAPARVLEEELVSNKNTSRPQEEFSACYLMDVLLVSNESFPRSRTPELSPSDCSVDSLASAIQKGFFDMEHHHQEMENQKLADNLIKRNRVKKSVSFMDETIQLPLQKSKDQGLVRRGGSLVGTSTGGVKPILNNHRVQRYTCQGQIHSQFEFEPSVPWTGKLVASEAFQLGYANNWASLETYVRRLQHTNSL